MILAYNEEHVGDVLLVITTGDRSAEDQAERVGDMVRVSLIEAPEVVVTWNIFSASAFLGNINDTGQVTLTDEQVEKVNTATKDTRFSETLEKDDAPKIVVGLVKSCKKHPDSDHLSITQTEVNSGEILQIVCNTPNIEAGQKVVVTKPGAMTPDGLVIWPGVLRGRESFGMICSAKELRLPSTPAKKGILGLPFNAEIGSASAVGE